LQHHGILGQKWGRRRYQNKDGSLTPEGRLRYLTETGTLTEKGKKAFLNKKGSQNKYFEAYLAYNKSLYVNPDGTLNASGKREYEKIYGPTTKGRLDELQDIADGSPYQVAHQRERESVLDSKGNLKKGTMIQRIANDEPVDNNRKYVSVFKDDNENYISMAEFLPLDLTSDIYQYNYKASRNLKIATGDDVMRKAIEIHGNKKLDSIYEDYRMQQGKMEISRIIARDETKRWMSDHNEEVAEQLNNFARDVMHNSSQYKNGLTKNNLTEYFSSKGYDAMVDIEDAFHHNFPLVIFKPKDSMTLSSKKSIYGGD
jgi:hypothetical protein